eukprot:TRINITY_DN4836_c0_g2_i1.p1 TRINITY_DN4836_c0_g2~~TRINITY_DN4836_c0_g2_i1.p1  ORF type:complete len:607 (+),score=118.73 TRINITY_DN4836_c0_g2_i1:97-1917(+)
MTSSNDPLWKRLHPGLFENAGVSRPIRTTNEDERSDFFDQLYTKPPRATTTGRASPNVRNSQQSPNKSSDVIWKSSMSTPIPLLPGLSQSPSPSPSGKAQINMAVSSTPAGAEHRGITTSPLPMILHSPMQRVAASSPSPLAQFKSGGGARSPSPAGAIFTSHYHTALSGYSGNKPAKTPSPQHESLFPPLSAATTSGTTGTAGGPYSKAFSPTSPSRPGADMDETLSRVFDSNVLAEHGGQQFDAHKPIRLVHALIEDGMAERRLIDFRTLAETYRRANDVELEAETYFKMALRYDIQKSYTKAISCYERYLRFCEETSNLMGIAISCNHIGVDYQLLGAKHTQNAIAFHTRHCEVADVPGKFVSLSNLGLLHFELNDLDTATRYFRDAVPFAQQMHNPAAESFLYSHLGTLAQIAPYHTNMPRTLVPGASAQPPEPHRNTVRKSTTMASIASEELLEERSVIAALDQQLEQFMNMADKRQFAESAWKKDISAVSVDPGETEKAAVAKKEQLHMDEAETYLLRHRELASTWNDARSESVACMQLGMLAHRAKSFGPATQYLMEALTLAQRAQDNRTEEEARVKLGFVRGSELMEAYMRAAGEKME